MSFITIKSDEGGSEIGGEVTFSGIDMGNGNKPMTVKALTDDTLIVKVPGGKHWTGNHRPQASHPGEYQVWKVKNRQDVNFSGRPGLKWEKDYYFIRLIGNKIASFPLR